MLSSLPSLPPLGAHELYFSSLSPSLYAYAAGNGPQQQQQQQHAAHGGQEPPRERGAAARTVHTALRADENAILVRKANIRRFGAGWLKPPGVSKTLQGMEDERMEREEQEAAALREQAMVEVQAAQLAAEQAAQAQLARQAADEGAGAGERDLDDDIPDADAGRDEDDDAADLSGYEEADDGDWIDEPEDDFLPQDEGEGDYAEDGPGGESMLAGAMGRDLDDGVPDAGSYQHTDTEEEDDSSSDDGAGPDDTDAARRRSGWMMRAEEAVRRSVGMADMDLTGSIFGSSPMAEIAAARRDRRRSRRSGGSAL